MINIFPQHFMGSHENIKDLLKNGTIVLDTNSLLNLYRFSENDQKKFLEILAKISDRLWMPYNVGEEFFSNRLYVMNEKKNLKKNLKKAFKSVNDKYKDIIENPNNFSKENIKIGHIKHEDEAKKRLSDAIETFNENINIIIDEFDFSCVDSTQLNNDNVLTELTKLYDKKVGIDFDKEILKDLYVEGCKRYKDSIPPGYKDNSKPEPKCYGDFLIWKEIINYAKQNDKDVLFISDDRKEDWCENVEGMKFVRRDLIKEFLYETDGKKFYSITTKTLVELATTELEIQDVDNLKNSLGKLNEFIQKLQIQDYDQILKPEKISYSIDSNYEPTPQLQPKERFIVREQPKERFIVREQPKERFIVREQPKERFIVREQPKER